MNKNREKAGGGGMNNNRENSRGGGCLNGGFTVIYM